MKKILSSMLCAIMILSISVTAFADENNEFTTDYNTDAFDALNVPDDIDNLDENSNITENKEDESRVIPDHMLQPWIVDDADVLSDEQENMLRQKLNEISNRQKFAVAIVIVDTFGSKTPMNFADDFYDYNGYGVELSENRDGAILAFSMSHKWYISTCGYGIEAITDAGRERMADLFKPYLKDKEYYSACDKFADLCDDYVTEARNGTAYDVGHLPKLPFPFMKRLGIAIIAGLLIAFIIVTIMKSKLTTVKAQDSAVDYTKEGSMVVNESRDMFLYSHVSKTEKAKDSDGGSSTHTSSSGSTHGGGGGSW